MKKIMIFILGTFFLLFAGCSCQRRPDKEHYTYEECYKEADCYYRNAKGKDKTICADWGKECRAIMRYEYCKDKTKRDGAHGFNECWLYRNQK